MAKRRMEFYILICYFIKSSAVYSTEENKFPKGHQEQLGSHQPREGNVEELWRMPTASVFYDNYVVKSKPVIFKGAAKESDAFQLWTDSYLRWVIYMAQKHPPHFFAMY
jgi:lysine-specific demethylase 8